MKRGRFLWRTLVDFALPPRCPACGIEQMVPEHSEFAGEGRVQHVWLCEECGKEFSTAVEFGTLAA